MAPADNHTAPGAVLGPPALPLEEAGPRLLCRPIPTRELAPLPSIWCLPAYYNTQSSRK